MLNSARDILKEFSIDLSRYDIFSIETDRSENPEDLFYKIETKSDIYIVCESDYFISLTSVLDEILQIHPEYDNRLEWVYKKVDSESLLKTASVNTPLANDKDTSLIYKAPSHVNYVTLRVNN